MSLVIPCYPCVLTRYLHWLRSRSCLCRVAFHQLPRFVIASESLHFVCNDRDLVHQLMVFVMFWNGGTTGTQWAGNYAIDAETMNTEASRGDALAELALMGYS